MVVLLLAGCTSLGPTSEAPPSVDRGAASDRPAITRARPASTKSLAAQNSGTEQNALPLQAAHCSICARADRMTRTRARHGPAAADAGPRDDSALALDAARNCCRSLRVRSRGRAGVALSASSTRAFARPRANPARIAERLLVNPAAAAGDARRPAGAGVRQRRAVAAAHGFGRPRSRSSTSRLLFAASTGRNGAAAASEGARRRLHDRLRTSQPVAERRANPWS